RRQDDELVAGEAARQEVQPGGATRPVEGERLADRGRRGPMVDSQGQQSHGVAILSAARAAPWAVRSLSASTPTQAKTPKGKARRVQATIVGTTMPRPRTPGRNRAWSKTAKTSHIDSALRTLGSVQRITWAVAVESPWPRAATLSTMPISSPKVKSGKAIVI